MVRMANPGLLYGRRLCMACPPGVGSILASPGGMDTNALDGHSRRPGRARDGCARSRSRRIAPPTALEMSVVGQTLPGLSNHCQETSRKIIQLMSNGSPGCLELAKRRGR